MTNSIFLYNYEYLYPSEYEDRRTLGNPVNVESMTLECHNVRRQTDVNGITCKRGWDFQLVNDPKGVWYCTSYDWALVLKTDENLAQYQKWKQMQREWMKAKKLAGVEHANILGPVQMLESMK